MVSDQDRQPTGTTGENAGQDNLEWVRLTPVEAVWLARAVQEIFENEGIPCRFESAFSNVRIFTLSDNDEPVTLLVPVQFAERAQELQDSVTLSRPSNDLDE